MANKISRRMVALSASAIATIYAAGFMLTRSADAGLAGSSSTATATASATAQPATSTPTAVVGASAPATAVSTFASATAYKDGTYTGQGTSRRGGVSVSVTVQSGAITNVQITSVSTQYPVSRIASLPGVVVKQQTANVNVISGATYSSQAFTQAVQQALKVAQATSGPVVG
jgi:uncharacterized protein with FMN-binding domain